MFCFVLFCFAKRDGSEFYVNYHLHCIYIINIKSIAGRKSLGFGESGGGGSEGSTILE